MNGYEYAILEELVDPIKNNNEEIVFCQVRFQQILEKRFSLTEVSWASTPFLAQRQ